MHRETTDLAGILLAIALVAAILGIFAAPYVSMVMLHMQQL